MLDWSSARRAFIQLFTATIDPQQQFVPRRAVLGKCNRECERRQMIAGIDARFVCRIEFTSCKNAH
jgi:hypothetical protein